jgi:hypothetical protein
MNIEYFAAIVDIVASVTVVVSFIFIGFQIRQNTHALRMGAAQASVQLASDNMGRVVESEELAELIVRPFVADAAGEEMVPLTPSEQMRISNFLSISFRHFEMLYTHRKYGIYEKELWESTRARMRQTLTRERVRDWWDDNKEYYGKSFARFVDDKVRDMEKNG